jgi:hypothetical protein
VLNIYYPLKNKKILILEFNLKTLLSIYMIRILITGLVIAIILFLFGARDAAHEVLDWSLTIVKWIFIIGALIFVGAMILSKKK